MQRDRSRKAISGTHELSRRVVEPQRADGEIGLGRSGPHLELAHGELAPIRQTNARRRAGLVGVVRLGTGGEGVYEAIVHLGTGRSAHGPQRLLSPRIGNG